MTRNILSSLLIAGPLSVLAGIDPRTPAPVIDHLTDVNVQWHVMDPFPADAATIVRFRHDADRIATHLHRVQQHLATHRPEGLSTTQSANRDRLLDRLKAYAGRGIFPENHVLPQRNPIFIDPHGTACAVGQLMIESGHRDLAERIDSEMETAYLHEIQLPEVDAWAVAHGFTRAELAWIQPGYLPNIPWQTLGGGTNGTVTTSLVLNDGRLLVAGTFTEAGGQAISRAAIWDGSSFTALGAGPLDGEVHCAIEYANTIILGGRFNVMQDLAIWDGDAWSYSTAFHGKTSQVNDLHVHEGELYAAGLSLGFAGPMHGVNRLYDGEWEPMGMLLNNEVHTLGSHQGTLVCGGAFTGVSGDIDPVLSHVAQFDQGWGPLGDGLDATVYDLLSLGSALYAGGTLFEGEETRFGLARLPAGANTWEGQFPNLEDYFAPWGTGASEIRCLYADGTEILFGGTFYSSDMMLMGQCLGKLTAPDQTELMGYFNDAVLTLAMHGGQIVAGGAFDQVNFASVPFLATSHLGTGIQKPAMAARVAVWPNPTTDQLFLELDGTRTVSIIDGAGRVVHRAAASAADRHAIDVSHLAQGTYNLVLTQADGTRRSALFMKQ